MVVLMGLLAGVAACLLRSAVAVILVASLIVACFLMAALMGPVHGMELVWAILGYNAGIALTFFGHLVLSGRSTRLR